MSERPQELSVWHGPNPAASDLNILKLAEFMGVPAHAKVLPQDGRDFWKVIEQHTLTGDYAFCINARTLMNRCQGLGSKGSSQVAAARYKTQLFVYGFDPDFRGSEVVSVLSEGRFSSVRNLDPRENEYSVLKTSPFFGQEFSGLTFGPTNSKNDVVFQSAEQDEQVKEFVRIGNHPFLAGIENPHSFVLFAGTREILDIDACFPRGVRLLNAFSQLVPLMMFLRHVFGRRCWHGARKLGSLIIDDPLLTGRYGFLHYESLLKAMEQSQFATNLAFIPWNYRRSRTKVINLFKRHPARYSLSVHGCDHTRAEFATSDSATLRAKARTALRRMSAHEQLTGLPFDRVMVFPGGHFSSEAIKTLKAANYVAAVNSTEFATDLPDGDLRIRDVLGLAVTRYSNFPLFIRRYPHRIAEFALDLFLGRPALIVVHHEDFENGYAEIQAFAEQLNSLCGGIKWCGLEEIARRSYLIKEDCNGDLHVRLHTDDVIVENLEQENRRFHLSRALEDNADLPRVTVNGKVVSSHAVDGGLAVKLELKAGEEAKVSLRTADAVVTGSLEAGSLLYRLNVRARRYLCEFRDNYVGPCRRVIFSDRHS
jgi:hypothetical protein